MLFACRYAEPMFIVQSDETEFIQREGRPNAPLVARTTQPDLYVEFRQGMGVSLAAKIGALHYFEGKGALMRMGLPSDRDGILGSKVYEGFEPQRNFSWYDTETMAPPQHRKQIEDYLLRISRGTDVWLYEPERVAAPWPAYDSIVTKAGFSRQNRADKITATVKELGIDPIGVIAYERENTNDELTVRKLEELISADIAQRAEDEALEVTV